MELFAMVGETVREAQIFTAEVALLLVVIGIIWFFLCVALFFKIWIMTNDVSKIKDMVQEQLDLEHPYVEVGKEDNKKLEHNKPA